MRKLFYIIHLYLGLSLGLIAIVIGLSGSLLVFRHELEAQISPELVSVEPQEERLPAAELVAAVRGAYPDGAIGTLMLPKHSTGSAEFWMKGDPLRIYVDPYTAKILGERDPESTFTGWLFELHTNLLAGENGDVVAAYTGLSLVVLSVSGLVVWWPRKNQKAVQGMVVKRGVGRKRLTYDLHRSVGFWACGFLLVVATTGCALAFPDQAKALSYRLFAGRDAPEKPVASPGPHRPLRELEDAAHRALPEGILARVMFPAKPEDAIIFRMRTPNELHPNGMNYVYIDPATARVLRVDRDQGKDRAQTAMNLRYPVHIGGYAGLFSKIIHASVGLVPTFLGVTGAMVWYNRRFGKRRAKKVVGSA